MTITYEQVKVLAAWRVEVEALIERVLYDSTDLDREDSKATASDLFEALLEEQALQLPDDPEAVAFVDRPIDSTY